MRTSLAWVKGFGVPELSDREKSIDLRASERTDKSETMERFAVSNNAVIVVCTLKRQQSEYIAREQREMIRGNEM